MAAEPAEREQWQTRLGFVLAATGSAIGIGNMWRFPTVAAEGGGGAFLLVYLLLVLAVGVPLMMLELVLGRASQRNVVATYARLVPQSRWQILGAWQLVAGFIILVFYSVVAGWILLYLVQSAGGALAQLDAPRLNQRYDQLIGHPFLPLVGQGLFIAATAGIVVTGVTRGIERWSRLLMPLIVLLLLALFVRTLFLDGAVTGMLWFLTPRLEGLSVQVALGALGQVFFSFSLGMGAILTYGSYLKRDDDIPANALLICGADVAVALLAGLVIIPALFAFSIDPETGPALLFVTLPAVFNTLPLGMLWTTLFFLLLLFAALTSSVSMLEVPVAYLVDERQVGRPAAAAAIAAVGFLVGVPAALAAGTLAGVEVGGLDLFALMDFTASNIMLPIGGLLGAVYVGWVWGTQKAVDELAAGASTRFLWPRLWPVAVRYILPVVLVYILVSGLL